jgi:hypothetical protein
MTAFLLTCLLFYGDAVPDLPEAERAALLAVCDKRYASLGECEMQRKVVTALSNANDKHMIISSCAPVE